MCLPVAALVPTWDMFLTSSPDSCLDHATVDAFHKAALEAGGTCNGAPGLRPQYHPNYYGAFVLDPLENNVEVVG